MQLWVKCNFGCNFEIACSGARHTFFFWNLKVQNQFHHTLRRNLEGAPPTRGMEQCSSGDNSVHDTFE